MSNEARESPRQRDYRWLLLVGIVGAAGAIYWFTRPEVPTDPVPAPATKAPSIPLPALSSSPFRNTAADVQYVGSAVCQECHAPHFHSYHRTGMGRSMALVDPDREPPDGVYDHALSKARYHVQRKEGRLWHRELLMREGGEEIVLNEHPVKYVVGSGRFARTYLIEVDGFLMESPITWYQARLKWGMSPGYDREKHAGFERDVGENCLTCHAGQARAAPRSSHRIEIKEPAISCERCHGPGELHVKHHAARKDEWVHGTTDYTIVNPAHLSRERAEAICQQCHLRASASVMVRGRSFGDFRPGLPLQDFRHDYRLEEADRAMTVVGHVEQMHLSRCYQGSKTFTCTTCHDPHAEPSPRRREMHYRKICLDCHQTAECRVEPAVLKEKSPTNHCVQCHMPTVPTEVPHVAFTQHRVGIHEPTKDVREPRHGGKGPTKFTPLVPFHDLAGVNDLDRRRTLGMAYLDMANQCADRGVAGEYRNRARDLLKGVQSEGLRDGDFLVALARVQNDLGMGGVVPLTRQALEFGCNDPQNHCIALVLAADGLARSGKLKEALPLFGELVSWRRLSSEMLMFADCERAAGLPSYIERLEAAARINPRLVSVHKHLADYFRKRGEEKKAEFHQKRAGR